MKYSRLCLPPPFLVPQNKQVEALFLFSARNEFGKAKEAPSGSITKKGEICHYSTESKAHLSYISGHDITLVESLHIGSGVPFRVLSNIFSPIA
jgi:hypothetical protein